MEKLTNTEKRALYESIMTKISKQLKSMLNEANATNDKERLASILNNWDKLSPEAKNILSNSIDKINNLNKSTETSQKPYTASTTKPNTSQQFNIEDAFIAPDTTILKQYVKSGNISKDFKTYANWSLEGLKELETKFDKISNKKQNSETKSIANEMIIDSFP